LTDSLELDIKHFDLSLCLSIIDESFLFLHFPDGADVKDLEARMAVVLGRISQATQALDESMSMDVGSDVSSAPNIALEAKTVTVDSSCSPLKMAPATPVQSKHMSTCTTPVPAKTFQSTMVNTSPVSIASFARFVQDSGSERIIEQLETLSISNDVLRNEHKNLARELAKSEATISQLRQALDKESLR
jgi:hypothetical protein